MKKQCSTCIHAEWKTTPSGRTNFRVHGKCVYPIPDFPPLPWCVQNPPKIHRWSIWKEDGENCPVWSNTFRIPHLQEEPEHFKLNLLREGDPLDD